MPRVYERRGAKQGWEAVSSYLGLFAEFNLVFWGVFFAFVLSVCVLEEQRRC
jgi:hypothetical protein